MEQQAKITSGCLKPIKNVMPCGYVIAIRLIAIVLLIGGILIAFATTLYLIPISLISALIIDGIAEIVNYLHRLACQEYELSNVTISLNTINTQSKFDVRV